MEERKEVVSVIPCVRPAVLLQDTGGGETRPLPYSGDTSGSVTAGRPRPSPPLQECSLRNLSPGTTSYNISQASLVPSQEYRVKVRLLVAPGEDSMYGGIPSEWSSPVTWTSHEGTLLSALMPSTPTSEGH